MTRITAQPALRRKTSLLLALALLILVAGARVVAQVETAADPKPKTYFRVIENTEDDTLQLDLAVRLFQPIDAENNPGPTIAYVGAIHIADAEFYAELQTYLDAQDLVLYEGVKPSGFGDLQADENTNDETKRQQTEMRLRFIAIMLERTKSTRTGYVTTFDDLAEKVTALAGRRVGEWVASSQDDAWGTPFDFTVAENKRSYTLRSFGADQEAGGIGPDEDLDFADQPTLNEAETGSDPGIQARLAKALGLTFQLDEMNEDQAHFRNVDMSIDEIEAAIAQEGGDPSFLFNMLDGSSIMASVMKFGLAIIEMSPMLQAMTKITLIETMRAVGENGMGQMRGLPENMSAVFDVIINKRNQVVIDEIKNILETKQVPTDATIAVIYGAGHLEDLEIQLAKQCNYAPTDEFWVNAMTVSIKQSGLSSDQLKMIRTMIETMN